MREVTCGAGQPTGPEENVFMLTRLVTTNHHLPKRMQNGGLSDPERAQGRKYHLSWPNTDDQSSRRLG
jgi:hypothetical protein